MCALHRALPVRHVRHAQMLYYAFAVTRGFTCGFYDAAFMTRLYKRTRDLFNNQRVALCIACQKRGN